LCPLVKNKGCLPAQTVIISSWFSADADLQTRAIVEIAVWSLLPLGYWHNLEDIASIYGWRLLRFQNPIKLVQYSYLKMRVLARPIRIKVTKYCFDTLSSPRASSWGKVIARTGTLLMQKDQA
jgi:hypothetical protein